MLCSHLTLAQAIRSDGEPHSLTHDPYVTDPKDQVNFIVCGGLGRVKNSGVELYRNYCMCEYTLSKNCHCLKEIEQEVSRNPPFR